MGTATGLVDRLSVPEPGDGADDRGGIGRAGADGLARGLLFLTLFIWWAHVGWHTFQGERYMAAALIYNQADPISSFAFAGKAYENFKASKRFRRQLVGSFNNALARHGKKLVTDKKTAEAIFAVGYSVSPVDVLTHVARSQFWLNHGRVDLVRESLTILQNTVPNLAHVWLIAAWEAAVSGRDPRPAARRGMTLSTTAHMNAQLQRFLQ